MSRDAKKYYSERSKKINVPTPALLDGAPRHLLTSGDRFNAKDSEISFRRALQGIGGFVLRAVVRQYPEAAGLKPNRHARTQEQHAGKLLAWLSEVAQNDEGLHMAYAEAMTRDEIAQRALYRATDGHYALREPDMENVQVYIVTTAIPRKDTEPSAHFTLVNGLYYPNARSKNLTPLYLGSTLTPKEVAHLPDYWTRSRQSKK